MNVEIKVDTRRSFIFANIYTLYRIPLVVLNCGTCNTFNVNLGGMNILSFSHLPQKAENIYRVES